MLLQAAQMRGHQVAAVEDLYRLRRDAGFYFLALRRMDASLLALIDFTGAHPNDTQEAAHFLWEVALLPLSSQELVSTAIDRVLDAEAAQMTVLWHDSAPAQRNLLVAMVAEENLLSLGFEPICVTTGNEALRVLGEAVPFPTLHAIAAGVPRSFPFHTIAGPPHCDGEIPATILP